MILPTWQQHDFFDLPRVFFPHYGSPPPPLSPTPPLPFEFAQYKKLACGGQGCLFFKSKKKPSEKGGLAGVGLGLVQRCGSGRWSGLVASSAWGPRAWSAGLALACAPRLWVGCSRLGLAGLVGGVLAVGRWPAAGNLLASVRGGRSSVRSVLSARCLLVVRFSSGFLAVSCYNVATLLPWFSWFRRFRSLFGLVPVRGCAVVFLSGFSRVALFARSLPGVFAVSRFWGLSAPVSPVAVGLGSPPSRRLLPGAVAVARAFGLWVAAGSAAGCPVFLVSPSRSFLVSLLAAPSSVLGASAASAVRAASGWVVFPPLSPLGASPFLSRAASRR